MTKPTRRLTAKQRVLKVLSDVGHPCFIHRWRICTAARTWADASRRLNKGE